MTELQHILWFAEMKLSCWSRKLSWERIETFLYIWQETIKSCKSSLLTLNTELTVSGRKTVSVLVTCSLSQIDSNGTRHSCRPHSAWSDVTWVVHSCSARSEPGAGRTHSVHVSAQSGLNDPQPATTVSAVWILQHMSQVFERCFL